MTTPHTNRGVDEGKSPRIPAAAVGLDWLQGSFAWPFGKSQFPTDEEAMLAMVAAVLPPHDKLIVSNDFIAPIRGYDTGLKLSIGRAFYHTKNAKQAIGLIFTGEDMRSAIDVMLPHEAMLQWFVAKAKRITRLDVAVDVRDPRADPLDILRHWKAGGVATPAANIEERTSYSVDKQKRILSAPTVYVGRRDSERMLRVYDKAAQMGQREPWVRVELQTRADQSMALARTMQANGIPIAGRQAIRNFCRVPECEWYELAMVGPLVGMAPMVRRETNPDKWLRLVALPALARATKEYSLRGDWTLYDALERALQDAVASVEDAAISEAKKGLQQ